LNSFLAKLDVGRFLDTAQELRGDRHHAREAEVAKAEAGHGAGEFEKVACRKVAATKLFADETQSRSSRK
jgi:hypothetical protein